MALINPIITDNVTRSHNLDTLASAYISQAPRKDYGFRVYPIIPIEVGVRDMADTAYLLQYWNHGSGSFQVMLVDGTIHKVDASKVEF